MAIRFRQQVAAWLLVLKAATQPEHAPGEPTRDLHERYLFVSLYITHAGTDHGAGMGLSVGAPRELLASVLTAFVFDSFARFFGRIYCLVVARRETSASGL